MYILWYNIIYYDKLYSQVKRVRVNASIALLLAGRLTCGEGLQSCTRCTS